MANAGQGADMAPIESGNSRGKGQYERLAACTYWRFWPTTSSG